MTDRVLHPYIKEAAQKYGTHTGFVMNPRQYRTAREVSARREIWTRMRADGLSLPAIAELTGCHHTSVMHGLQQSRRAG